jgi:hypothetical protein
MNALHNGILPERLVIVDSEWKAYSGVSYKCI